MVDLPRVVIHSLSIYSIFRCLSIQAGLAERARNGTRWSAVDAACVRGACTPISRAPATPDLRSRPRHRRPSSTRMGSLYSLK
jgi:hypothetical protein